VSTLLHKYGDFDIDTIKFFQTKRNQSIYIFIRQLCRKPVLIRYLKTGNYEFFQTKRNQSMYIFIRQLCRKPVPINYIKKNKKINDNGNSLVFLPVLSIIRG